MQPFVVCTTVLVLQAAAWATEPVHASPPTGTIALGDAVARALAASADVRAAARGIRVHEALALQAAAFPNPELSGEVENVGGSGDRQGFEQTESTVLLAQRIELGGKRGARMRQAEQERSLAAWDHETARLAVVAAATKAFFSALAAQERLALTVEMERLARETAAAIDRSVAAGGTAPVEATRARVTLARAVVERGQAERALDGARTLLAATWNEPRASVGRLEGSLAAVGPLPAEADLVAALERSPAVARWANARAARAAAAALERARRIPDVTVGAGGRHFSDNGDNALVFELSLPLPVFDRNGAAVVAAREREAQTADEAEAARAEARRTLAEAYLRLAEARGTAVALADGVLRDARRTVTDSMEAFRKGVLAPADLLLARRALIEVERERLDALERFHLAAADVERLTGAPLAGASEGGGR